MELKHRERIVQIKIVYYGPALGGKTTNLQMLHAAAQEHHRGEFVSVNSAQDRTILFDLVPFRGLGLHGLEIRFQLMAVPGQAQFFKARHLVVGGADAVVFVANSAVDRLHENLTSLREMTEQLAGNQVDAATIPLVFQHNKRDLPQVLSLEELRRALGYRLVPHLPAVAIRGEGVLETFRTVMVHTMDHIVARYESLSLPPGETAEEWTAQALQRIFGVTSIARATPEPPATPKDRRILRVYVPRSGAAPHQADRPGTESRPQLPADDPRSAGQRQAHSQDGLTETYAQASMELSAAVEHTREERDEARRQVQELQQALRAIEAVELSRVVEQTLRDLLQLLVAAGGGQSATLLVSSSSRVLRRVAGVGLDHDPFLRGPDEMEVVRRLFVPLRDATLFETEANGEVARIVASLKPPVQAVAGIPVRSALGLHGLVLIYFGQTDLLPAAPVMTHLLGLGRVLAAWFSVHRALTLRGASAGTAFQGLPELQRAAQLALDLVRKASHTPEGAAATLERAESRLVRVVQELSRVNATAGSSQPPSHASPQPSTSGTRG